GQQVRHRSGRTRDQRDRFRRRATKLVSSATQGQCQNTNANGNHKDFIQALLGSDAQLEITSACHPTAGREGVLRDEAAGIYVA
ncbi:MAG: hypothetical protein WBH75_11415, partial [Thermoanaerobaculia bacterium]